MRYRKTEPENVRDMWFASMQSGGSPVLNYMRVCEGEPEIGAVYDEYDAVVTERHDAKNVVIKHVENVVADMHGNGSFSSTGKAVDIERMTFSEFRDSKYWDPYMKAMARRNFDSSFVDSWEVDDLEDCARISFDMPMEENVWWCSSPVCSGDIGHAEVFADNGGFVSLALDGEIAEGSIARFIEAVKTLEAMEQSGIAMEDGELRVDVRKGGEE